MPCLNFNSQLQHFLVASSIFHDLPGKALENAIVPIKTQNIHLKNFKWVGRRLFVIVIVVAAAAAGVVVVVAVAAAAAVVVVVVAAAVDVVRNLDKMSDS
jgi:hypothetical protein